MGADIARAKPFRVPQDSLCFVALATLARQTGDPPPGPLLEEAMALFPDHPHLLWLAGQVAQDEQRFAAAAEYFEALRRFDPATFIDPSLAFDRRMFDLWAVAGLAAARLGAGEYPAAAALYAEASRGAPDVLEYRLKQALAARLAAGPVS
jgi:tetratricopeptide (TPR) repeat protein